ncbi:MAG: hypothetical protein ABIH86_06715 [Planctomycetota bacterium]
MSSGLKSRYLWIIVGCALFAGGLAKWLAYPSYTESREKKAEIDAKWTSYLERFGPAENRIEQTQLNSIINSRNTALIAERDRYKESLEMKFPDWVNGLTTRPAHTSIVAYFRRSLNDARVRLRQLTDEKRVDMSAISDHLIFQKSEIENLDRMTELLTIRQLQYLAIAEMVVQRAVEAKAEQERHEIVANIDPINRLSYMKILSLSYKSPNRTAPVKLMPNPKHIEWLEERRVTGGRQGRTEPPKYIGVYYEPFIIEYPIELEMICDDRSLMRFLSSLQKQGEVLTIQRIQILSPGILLAPDAGQQPLPAAIKDIDNDQHVYVKLAAVGQIFRPVSSEEPDWKPPEIAGSEVRYERPKREASLPVESGPMGY